MRDREEVVSAAGRAGKRVLIHLLQAAIEGVKAVEAVIDEFANLGENYDGNDKPETERIDVE